MCGIAGWILTDVPSPTFALTLAFHMQKRGMQSFGVYNGETEETHRDIGSIVSRCRALSFCKGFLHTRHATTGKNTIENCHPFAIGGIVGAHNGMIYNHAELNKKYSRSLPVDSMHIFAHIADSLSTSELEGYGSIEYVRDGQYYIAASNEGELEVAKLSNGIVWASTREAIEDAAFQSGVTIENFYAVEQNHVYHVDASGLYETDARFELTEPSWASSKLDREVTRGIVSDSSWSELFKDKDAPPAQDTKPLDYTADEDGTFPYEFADATTDEVSFDDLNLRTYQDSCTWCNEYRTVAVCTDCTMICERCFAEMADYIELSELAEPSDIPELSELVEVAPELGESN